MNNRSLKTLFTFNSIFVFAGSLLGPLYAVYVANIDKRIMLVSFSWGAFLISATFFTFLVSRLGDKVKAKDTLLMGGYIVRAIAWLSYLFVGSIGSLIAIQALLGLGEALGSPAFDALFAEHLDKNKHILEYSDWKLISTLVTALGTILGGLIIYYAGFKLLFLLMFSLSLVSFFGILFRQKRVL